MSYVTELMSQFNVERHQVEQEGSKQCAVVYVDSRCLFVSYSTVVGFTDNGHWYFTEEKHSVTTSCQISAFDASRAYLPEEVWNKAYKSDNNADAIIYSFEEAERQRIEWHEDFKREYTSCMDSVEQQVSTSLISFALPLDTKALNRLKREAKAEAIAELVDYLDGHKEKHFNKFSAKFNKAMKAAK